MTSGIEDLLFQLDAEIAQLEQRHMRGNGMFEDMIALLDAAWLLRKEIVPCLVGPPGIGKTAAVMEHAHNHGCGKVVKIVASRCVPSETVGMTMPNHGQRSMDIYNSRQLSSLEDGDILFLDELLEADQFVLSTLLTVIESREMADGTPLPDIQIVAATNSTIPAEQLKGNIRQRFMFQTFGIDADQTAEYIRERTGFELPDDILVKLVGDGPDYNFLTPRSLTKLCLWIDATDEANEHEVAHVINMIWKSEIGTKILKAKRNRDAAMSPEEQVRRAIIDLVPGTADTYHFENCTIPEMIAVIKECGLYDLVTSKLAELEIEEAEGDDVDIEF